MNPEDLKNLEELVLPTTLAKELKVTVGTLAVWRCTGRYDLPYIKVGSLVRYIRPGIEEWKRKRLHVNGSEAA